MTCDDYCCNHGCNRGPSCPARRAPVAPAPSVRRTQLRTLARWLLISAVVLLGTWALAPAHARPGSGPFTKMIGHADLKKGGLLILTTMNCPAGYGGAYYAYTTAPGSNTGSDPVHQGCWTPRQGKVRIAWAHLDEAHRDVYDPDDFTWDPVAMSKYGPIFSQKRRL